VRYYRNTQKKQGDIRFSYFLSKRKGVMMSPVPIPTSEHAKKRSTEVCTKTIPTPSLKI